MLLTNTNLFGTFLRAGSGITKAPEGQTSGLLDILLKALGERKVGEMVPFTDLISHAGGSFDALIAAIKMLADRGMVEESSGGVTITPAGKSLAESIRPPA